MAATCMLAIGARFDDRVTGRLNAFSQGSRKIHIDIDGSSINKNVPVEVPIIADAGKALEALAGGLGCRHDTCRYTCPDGVVAPDR